MKPSVREEIVMDQEKRAGAPEKTQFETIATRVSVVCGAGNLLLAAFKFAAGRSGIPAP